ncbi:SCO7613 C-terminal domain-containing membrane protein [Nocardioides sp. LML1-1-1.1]|uniref:SCO7613 C-terminal domain-containing membrane protein n=1 Tax=Nocardioides sp. LML1-1-1.1 TaxID=3135248 RepID=UPI003449C931
MRYADPTLCPDCRSALPTGAPVCPACDLLVRHPVAVDLFRTLRRADELVGALRRASDAFHDVPAPAPVAARASSLGGPLVPPGTPPPDTRAALPPYPAPAPTPAPARTGVTSSSVPKILLGLGAFCLLVAAVVFLAVSWSALGVGGRTAVLGGLTLAAGSGALLLHRSGLRIAGESLVVVTLGLLALDVVGAGAAGWLGGSGDTTTLATGLTVLVASVLLALARLGDQPRLVAPQVIAGIALVVAWSGLAPLTGHPLVVAHVVTAAAIGLVLLGRTTGLVPLQWSTAAAGALAAVGVAVAATTDALVSPGLHQLWAEGSGWSLLVTAAVLLAPGAVLRHRALALAGASGAAMVVTLVLTLPCVDSDTTTVNLVALLVSAVWVGALALLPRTVRVVAVAPSVLGGTVLAALALVTLTVAAGRWGSDTHAFAHPLSTRIGGPDPVTEPLLLVPSLLLPLALVSLLATGPRRAWLQAAGVTTALGLAATLASYDVPLALPVTVVVLAAIGAAAARTSALAVVALVLAAAATVAALPSAALTGLVAAAGTVLALGLALIGRTALARAAGRLAAAPLLAATVIAVVHLAGGGAAWFAVPVLVAVGVLAIALPEVEVEVPAVLTALLVLSPSYAATTDPAGLAALWLTVAGCLASATALVHASRRPVAWAGSALLLLASWVRLADLGVHAPEAYTLPLAASLLAVGGWRMQRSPRVGTAEALLPGLLLGTVPSLLWVLGDPVSLRALVLGAACLVLTVAGAAARWSAPLLVGASVGAIVVLRELGPYAGDFPKWVWIGLAGLLLTAVGITWERRLVEVRRAVGLLGRLR